jgi:hypothetical protein
MSLSAREQQVLDSIKDQLTDSDPKLARLLATFTRLASGEEMPLWEKIRSGSRRVSRSRRERGQGTMSLRPHSGGQRLGLGRGTLLMLWLLVSVVLIAVAVILSQGSSKSPGGCTESWPAVCATSRPSAPVQQLTPGG